MDETIRRVTISKLSRAETYRDLVEHLLKGKGERILKDQHRPTAQAVFASHNMRRRALKYRGSVVSRTLPPIWRMEVRPTE